MFISHLLTPKVWGGKDDMYYEDLVLVLVLGCAL